MSAVAVFGVFELALRNLHLENMPGALHGQVSTNVPVSWQVLLLPQASATPPCLAL